MKVPDVWAAVLMGMAVYRISRLVVVDKFPPVAKLRDWFKYHWPDTGDIVSRKPKRGFLQPNAPAGTDPRDIERWRVIQGTSLGYLISCMYCTPFWVAVLIWGAWQVWPEQTLIFCTPWALATVGTLLHRWEQR